MREAGAVLKLAEYVKAQVAAPTHQCDTLMAQPIYAQLPPTIQGQTSAMKIEMNQIAQDIARIVQGNTEHTITNIKNTKDVKDLLGGWKRKLSIVQQMCTTMGRW